MLEVNLPLKAAVTSTQNASRQSYFLVGTLAVLSLLSVTLVVHHLRQSSKQLEQRVEQRTAELRDVTGREQAEIRKRQHLQLAVRALEQVLGVVGHELRTPLAAVRVTSELLLTDAAKQADEFDVLVTNIHDETGRMAEMVDNMLEVARLNSGCANWNWSEVRLLDVCKEACDTILCLIQDKNLELFMNIDPPHLSMNSDGDALRRLIVNLLSNSAKHTSEGTIQLTARDVTKPDGRWVSLKVEDTGGGISEAIAKKLGQAFALNGGLVGSDYVKGSGLGLAICKGIVAAHAGTISVTSEPDQGTTFTVLLQADRSTPAQVKDNVDIKLEA